MIPEIAASAASSIQMAGMILKGADDEGHEKLSGINVLHEQANHKHMYVLHVWLAVQLLRARARIIF